VGGLPATVPAFAAACSRQLAIAVAGGATAATAATTIRTGLIADGSFTNSTVAGNVVTAIDTYGGERENDADSSDDSLFGVVQSVAGASFSISVAYNAAASTVESLFSDFFTVTKAGSFSWQLTRTATGTSAVPVVANNGTLVFRSGVEGALSFRRQALRQAFEIAGTDDLAAYLEIKLTFTGLEPTVVLQIGCTVTKDVIVGTSSAGDYELALTGLTGIAFKTFTDLEGGAGYLDGVATTGLSVPRCIAFPYGGQLAVYELVSGTDAESSPEIIRPLDFDAVTNAKVWKRLL
jgi:hypothetical protein